MRLIVRGSIGFGFFQSKNQKWILKVKTKIMSTISNIKVNITQDMLHEAMSQSKQSDTFVETILAQMVADQIRSHPQAREAIEQTKDPIIQSETPDTC